MADDQAATGVTIDGFVERIDEHVAVEGWAFDRRDPERVLDVELWAGTRCLATTRTGVERPDVCESRGLSGRPGFRFADDTGDAIRRGAAAGDSEQLIVRVAGEVEPLPGVCRTLDDVRLDAPRTDAITKDAFLDLLRTHERTSKRALDRPLPPLPDRATGFVEALWPDELGHVWITGWIAEDDIVDRPAIILDDAKHAAGFSYAIVRRDDLPTGNVGFVGLLRTAWRPGSTTPPYLLMADTGDRFLEPLLPSPLRSKDAIAPLIAHYLAHGEGRYRDLLRDLFHTTPQWSVPEDRSTADRLQVDELVTLPGFGAFVSGWVLSPSKTVESFTLKSGSQVLAADMRSICRHDRPDLANVYPNLADMTGSAGFIAMFRGDLGEVRADDLIVKAIWHDRSSTNDRVVPSTIRVLGLTAPIDTAYRFYPELESAHFFSDFAKHAALNARAQAREVRGYEVQPVTKALIFAAGVTSSDLFLLYDNILRHAASLSPEWGIAMIAESDQQRPLILSLFADLRRATGRACSLFFTRRGRPSTHAIEAMLQELGAERFAYLDAGAALTENGWKAIEGAGDGTTLLAIDDPTAGSVRAGLDAFVSHRAHWLTLVSNAAPAIGGIVAPELAAVCQIVPGAAVSLGTNASAPLITRINQAAEPSNG